MTLLHCPACDGVLASLEAECAGTVVCTSCGRVYDTDEVLELQGRGPEGTEPPSLSDRLQSVEAPDISRRVGRVVKSTRVLIARGLWRYFLLGLGFLVVVCGILGLVAHLDGWDLSTFLYGVGATLVLFGIVAARFIFSSALGRVLREEDQAVEESLQRQEEQEHAPMTGEAASPNHFDAECAVPVPPRDSIREGIRHPGSENLRGE